MKRLGIPSLCAVLVAMTMGVSCAQDALATPTPTPLPTPLPVATSQLIELIPSYRVGDLKKAADFYTQKLGFQVVLVSGTTYASVARDVIQIGLAVDTSKARPKGFSYVQVSGVDALYQEFKGKGVKMLKDIKTQPSKMREFSVEDPYGNVLMFGEYTGR